MKNNFAQLKISQEIIRLCFTNVKLAKDLISYKLEQTNVNFDNIIEYVVKNLTNKSQSFWILVSECGKIIFPSNKIKDTIGTKKWNCLYSDEGHFFMSLGVCEYTTTMFNINCEVGKTLQTMDKQRRQTHLVHKVFNDDNELEHIALYAL